MAGIGDLILFLIDYIQEHILHAPMFLGTMSTGMGAASDRVDYVHARKVGHENREHSGPLSYYNDHLYVVYVGRAPRCRLLGIEKDHDGPYEGI